MATIIVVLDVDSNKLRINSDGSYEEDLDWSAVADSVKARLEDEAGYLSHDGGRPIQPRRVAVVAYPFGFDQELLVDILDSSPHTAGGEAWD